jgi:hypothetical protein
MMNRIKIMMNRNFFNSKLNREKLLKNKIMYCLKYKSNNYLLNNVRNYHSYNPQNDENEPPNWKLFAIAALGIYIINNYRR